MKSSISRRPLLIVAAGLLGMSLHWVAVRYWPPAIPAGDFPRGCWFGVCLGLEVVGLWQMRRPGRRSTA